MYAKALVKGVADGFQRGVAAIEAGDVPQGLTREQALQYADALQEASLAIYKVVQMWEDIKS